MTEMNNGEGLSHVEGNTVGNAVPEGAIPANEAPAVEAPASPEQQLSQAAQQYQYERDMFVKGAEANAVNLPGNFKDFGDYFDSLKEAQGQYTEARQELAKMRADEAARLATGEPEAEVAEGEVTEGELPDSLEIPEPEAEAEVAEGEEGDYEVYEVGMTEEEGMAWTGEFMETGTLTEETMGAILKSFPGATEDMVLTYMAGLKAAETASMEASASAVGGVDNLNNILSWAGENLSADERAAANAALAGPMASYTLRGLQAQYEAAMSQTRTATEPSQIPGRVASAAAAQTIQAYSSPAEMNADMANPEYRSNPAFQQQVQQRLAMTPWVYGG